MLQAGQFVRLIWGIDPRGSDFVTLRPFSWLHGVSKSLIAVCKKKLLSSHRGVVEKSPFSSNKSS